MANTKVWVNPGPINPCGAGENARDPSCMAVANALGVRYTPNAADRALVQAQPAPPQPTGQAAPPTADPQAAPADVEFDDGLTEEDWEAAFPQLQADTRQGGQQQKRHRIRDRRLRKRAHSTASAAVIAVSESAVPSVSGWLHPRTRLLVPSCRLLHLLLTSL